MKRCEVGKDMQVAAESLVLYEADTRAGGHVPLGLRAGVDGMNQFLSTYVLHVYCSLPVRMIHSTYVNAYVYCSRYIALTYIVPYVHCSVLKKRYSGTSRQRRWSRHYRSGYTKQMCLAW